MVVKTIRLDEFNSGESLGRKEERSKDWALFTPTLRSWREEKQNTWSWECAVFWKAKIRRWYFRSEEKEAYQGEESAQCCQILLRGQMRWWLKTTEFSNEEVTGDLAEQILWNVLGESQIGIDLRENGNRGIGDSKDYNSEVLLQKGAGACGSGFKRMIGRGG